MEVRNSSVLPSVDQRLHVFQILGERDSKIRLKKSAVSLLAPGEFRGSRAFLQHRRLSGRRYGAVEVREHVRGAVLLHVPEGYEFAAGVLVLSSGAEVIAVLLSLSVLIDAKGVLEDLKLFWCHRRTSGISSQVRPSNRRPADFFGIASMR